MVFSLPSFLAAATSAAIPPPAFTEVTVAQLTLAEWLVAAELGLPPQAPKAAAAPAAAMTTAERRIVCLPRRPCARGLMMLIFLPPGSRGVTRTPTLASKAQRPDP